jgi:hypothetical protein
MNRPFETLFPPEESLRRRALFAIQLVDAATLLTISEGVKVVAEGLNGKPVVNASGLFVWLQEDIGRLRKVSIDPGILPYEGVELEPAQLRLPPLPRPLTTVELPPRVDYAFAAGITGMRGRLIEERVIPPQVPEPVRNAEVRLRWLDENGDWLDAPTLSHTDRKSGDFVSILRLGPTDKPDIDASGAVTVRLRAIRDGANERASADLNLLQGRITDPSTLNPMTFAWDELQP